MSASNDVGIKLQEKCQHQQAYVHAVHISISGYDNIIVSQIFYGLVNIECSLQQIELFIFINYFFDRPKQFNGLPFRLKTACVVALRLLVMLPDAESPSVMNSVDSSLFS